MGLRHVAVPVRDGNPAFLQQIRNAPELVVNQAFQRGNVQHANALGRILAEQGEDGEERRLGLAACGGGSQEQVVFAPEDGFRRRNLHVAQGIPVVGVDEFPDEVGKPPENLVSSHRSSSSMV